MDRLNGKNIRTKTHHAGTSEGAKARPGVGIGEILPRSDVLGLEDEATVPGVPCSIRRSVASAKAVTTHCGVGGDFAEAGGGDKFHDSGALLWLCFDLPYHLPKNLWVNVAIKLISISNPIMASSAANITNGLCRFVSWLRAGKKPRP